MVTSIYSGGRNFQLGGFQIDFRWSSARCASSPGTRR